MPGKSSWPGPEWSCYLFGRRHTKWSVIVRAWILMSFVLGTFLTGVLATTFFAGATLVAKASAEDSRPAGSEGKDDAVPSTVEGGRRLLETAENTPNIQVLVPGFTVRELPVELPNINNVKYRADGTLVAL